jgi:hypothetical protein
MGGNPIKRAPSDRLIKIALDTFNICAAIQSAIEFRKMGGPQRNVSGDCVLGCGTEQQGADSGSSAQIQRLIDERLWRQPQKAQGARKNCGKDNVRRRFERRAVGVRVAIRSHNKVQNGIKKN